MSHASSTAGTEGKVSPLLAAWQRVVGAALRLTAGLPQDMGPLLFVALVWLAQAYLLYDFIQIVGVNLPYYDEWEMIPVLTGNQAISFEWLWAQHNEHRIVLPRLIYLLVQWVGRYDFRAGMFFDAALLSLTAAACIVMARRLRGSVSYADAFFPLLLLHWGQSENLNWSFQIAFIAVAVLTVVALLLLTNPGRLSFRAALGLGICTFALPLTGGAGLALVPALGLCTLVSAWDLWRVQPKRVRQWLPVLSLALGAFVLMGFYFVGYERPAKHPVSPGWSSTFEATLQLLTISFGAGAKVYWPKSGALILGLTLPTLAVLTFYLLRSREERPRALRLGLFIGGMIALAGGIGWARVALNPHGVFSSRYVTLVAPFLCALYFSWELLERRQVTRFVQMTLFLISAVLVVGNRENGYREAMAARARREVVLNDIRSGIPRLEIARRHCRFLYYVCNTSVLADRLRMLREKRAGDFATMRE